MSSLQISRPVTCYFRTGRHCPIADQPCALRSSLIKTRACEAHATPCPLQVCNVSLRGLCSHYFHHNSKQTCKLLSECNHHHLNTFPQSPRREEIISDNYTNDTFTGEYAALPFWHLNCGHHAIGRSSSAKMPSAAAQPHTAEELQLHPWSSGCASLCSLIPTDRADTHFTSAD